MSRALPSGAISIGGSALCTDATDTPLERIPIHVPIGSYQLDERTIAHNYLPWYWRGKNPPFFSFCLRG